MRHQDIRSARDRMLAGEPYEVPDPELMDLGNRARALLRRFNDTPTDRPADRIATLRELLGRFGRSWIEPPFLVDYGVNITIGDETFINMNCTFLDSHRIVIGNRTAIAPGVQLLTVGHPLHPAERYLDRPDDPDLPFRAVCVAKPVTIGNDVWLGAGVIVLPGVTIGDGTTIGAGSVVTRSIPPHVLAYGNPCRVIRPIGERTVEI